MAGKGAQIKHSRKAVFDFIVGYKRENDGLSPSYREIMDACGITSLSNMRYILDDLDDAGQIILLGGARSIAVNGGKWIFEQEVKS